MADYSRAEKRAGLDSGNSTPLLAGIVFLQLISGCKSKEHTGRSNKRVTDTYSQLIIVMLVGQ